jgi:transposase
LEAELRRVACRTCGTVKREGLDWLADNPFYTKRFAWFVGRPCRASTITDVAKELHLDWHTVKELEKQYMREQLRRQGAPRPKVIGIDEVSIKKGHTYRIVVSDLERQRRLAVVPTVARAGKARSKQTRRPRLVRQPPRMGRPKSFRWLEDLRVAQAHSALAREEARCNSSRSVSFRWAQIATSTSGEAEVQPQ